MSSARAFFPEISHYVPNPQDFWGCFLAAFLTFLSVHRTRPTPFSPGKNHLLIFWLCLSENKHNKCPDDTNFEVGQFKRARFVRNYIFYFILYMIIPTKQLFCKTFFRLKNPPPSLEIASRLFRRPSDASKELRCSLFSLSYFLFQEQSQIYVHQEGATSEGRFHKMKMSYFFRCANRKCAFKFLPFAKRW